jgi:two-component system response regulator YesN
MSLSVMELLYAEGPRGPACRISDIDAFIHERAARLAVKIPDRHPASPFTEEIRHDELHEAGDLARRYYAERNPFLSELSCTLPAQMIVVPLIAKVDYGFTGFISGRAILEHSLRAAVNEVLLDSGSLGRLIQLEDGNWLVLFQRDLRGETPGILMDGSEFDWEALRKRCASLHERFRSLWRCVISFSVGRPVACENLAAEYEVLNAKDSASPEEIAPEEEREEQGEKAPDYMVWMLMLRSGEKYALIKEATRFLVPLYAPPKSDCLFLRRFQQDFLQAIYGVLEAKGIAARELCDDGDETTLWDKACRSVDDMVAWLAFAVLRSAALLEAVNRGRSVVDKVKRYVAENLDGDLSRKKLAEVVYLNPDYLARLFKKETGLSVWEYVLNERITLAKDLLAKTDIPVSTVALQVGYNNFSHFSEAFRKQVGVCPAEFRRGSQPSAQLGPSVV